jgi:hypothetical protein
VKCKGLNGECVLEAGHRQRRCVRLTDAINKDAINETPRVQPHRPAKALQPDLPPAAVVKVLDSHGRTPNRRKRGDYNEYMRGYMKKRRAGGVSGSASSGKGTPG